MRRLFLKLIRRKRLQRDLESELAFHAEMSCEHQNPVGLGNLSIIKEHAFDLWRFNFVENFWRDLIYAGRGLRQSPTLVASALLSLGLGIGANTSIFQLLDAVRLRSLPVQSPQELAAVQIVGGHGGMGVNPGEYPELTRPIWQELQNRQQAFSGLFAWAADQVNIGQGAGMHRVKAMWVSGDFFRVLGIRPWRGRPILPADEGPCPQSAAVVSYAYWQSAMGGAPIDHTTLLVDESPVQVIGVAPPDFDGLSIGDRFDMIFPLCRPKELRRDVFDIAVMGRLRPGWTLKRASAHLETVSPGIFESTAPTGRTAQSIEAYKRFRLAAFPASGGVSLLREQYDSSLWLLLTITGLVLLIACANLANLLLARASTREREMAIRLALGASARRLLQQLFIEGGLLATIGALLGIAIAPSLSRVLVWSLSTEGNTVSLPIATDWRVLLFTASVSALTCMIFGAVPARDASRADPVSAMKAGGRGVTGSRQRFFTQRALVVMQIAVSLMLLIGALLFVRSFRKLLTFDPGMRESNIAVAILAFQKSNIAPAHYRDFQRRLLEEVRSIPGIRNAATTTNIPLVGGSWEHGIHIGSAQGTSKFTWVSPGYFDTMGIPLIIGRGFNQNDTDSSQRVAVVNQTFVRKFLGAGSPIGQTLRTDPEGNYPSTVYEIIGVIPDTKYNSLRGDTPPMTFAPASQFPAPGPWTLMMIHSTIAPSAVISTVKRVMAQEHPEIVTVGGNFQNGIRDGMVQERLMAMLSGFFGFLAALLAMVGLYGVVSYLVASRRNEIGVRMALGASRWQVVGMVMRDAWLLLAAGVALGAVLSLIAGGEARSLLFGLKPDDPLTFAAASALLAAISAVASFLPARRAAKVDPMIALRYE
ncbi:MAG: ABC transporter permease [Acidobacteriaceae bacterium]|nr:ABC transporter permease [Acidobacteriaceae bacterium]